MIIHVTFCFRSVTALQTGVFQFVITVKYALKNPGLENYDVLVMTAPTVDITNLDTSKLSPVDNTEVYQQNVIVSAQNMLSLAKASLEQN